MRERKHAKKEKKEIERKGNKIHHRGSARE